MSDFEGLSRDALKARVRFLERTLLKLVRQGDDGVWRTTQHGDADVTAIVAPAISQDKRADG